MAFVDQFTKIPFVNKSDPEYIPGTSPAISAENLNAIQDGIVDSLEAADGIDARVADVEDVFEGTLGVKCEILNTSVTIQTTDWQEDAANVRYTATITNAAITTETDVEIVLADADKGNYALNALNPANGSVTLFIGTPPKVPLVLQLIVYEVKNIPLASAAGGGLTPSPPRVGCAYVRGAATGAVGAGYFGDGSDGDVVISGDTPLDVQEDTGQIIKQYKNLTVNAGAILRPAHRCNGMILLVQEDCTIAGKISVSKCAPLLNEAEEQCQNESHIRLCGALVGGNGGKGGNGRRGGAQGGVGGNGFAFGGGYGGGGAGDPADRGVSAAGGPSEPRPPKGITWPCTTNSQYGAGGQGGLQRSSYPTGGTADGGAAPGGSGGTYYVLSFVEGDPHGAIEGLAGDAYGGGALWLFVGGQLKIESTGEIEADGGIGASTANDSDGDANGNPGLGGSGGGGIIALVHTGNYVNSGTVHANGGAAAPPPAYATGMWEWPSGSRGAAGSIGTVLVTNIQDLFGGTT